MASTTNPEEAPLKKRNDAYTGFLAISFLAMVGGCVLLYLDYQNYEGKNVPKAPALDVPGVNLDKIKGSAIPQPKVEPKADENKDTMMLPPPAAPAPAFLPTTVMNAPLTPVEPIQPVRSVQTPMQSIDSVVQIPVVPNDAMPGQQVSPPLNPKLGQSSALPPLPDPQFQPMTAPSVQPIIPNFEPNVSDAPPPLPQRPFAPPM